MKKYNTESSQKKYRESMQLDFFLESINFELVKKCRGKKWVHKRKIEKKDR